MNKIQRLKTLGAGAVVAAMLFIAAPAGAQAATVTEMLKQIAELQQQIQELQSKLADIRGQQQELRREIRAGLKEGMTDEDIKEIQELLASDPDIYPRGLITGYFGPLTREALMKFQAKAALKVSGEIDEETREYLEELLKERFDGKVPPGLLRAPGIWKKVKDRMEHGCVGMSGMGFLCQDKNDDNANDDGANDDDTNDNEGKEVVSLEIDMDGGTTTVTVKYEDNDTEEFEFGTTDEEELVEALADELNMSENDVQALVDEELGHTNDDIDEIEVTIDEEDNNAHVVVKYENGDEEEFDVDDDDEDDIIEAIADELDMNEGEAEDLIDWQ